MRKMANYKKPPPHCTRDDTKSIFGRRDRTSQSPTAEGGPYVFANSEYEALKDAGLISWAYATDLPRGS
jgi:hypothetical protein